MGARDALEAIGRRAYDPRANYHHQPCSAPVCGSRHCQTARDRERLLILSRAVFLLHAKSSVDDMCTECLSDWPCDTVAVIEKSLHDEVAS